jgi:uncharacterized repeat protein (TIGR03803 family)
MNKTILDRFIAFMCIATLLALAGCGGGGSSNGSSGSAGSFAVGGTVSGLNAATVTLLNNGTDALTVSANGTFKFASNVASGSAYAVTVQSHTPGVACAVSNGSGTVGSSAVTGVTVSCGVGTLTTLYTFDGSGTSVDAQYSTAGLVMDSAGNFYGTSQGGGDFFNGTVFKITPAGVLTRLYSFTGGSDGANPNASLAIDSNGMLYGTTYSGGILSPSSPVAPCYDTGCGTVFKISTSGTGFAVLHSFGTNAGGSVDTTDGRSPQASLILDGAGNLYGTTSYGGIGTCTVSLCGNGTIFKIATQGSSYSVLYRFAGGVIDGQNPQARLTLDGAGILYGTTSSGGVGSTFGTVFKVSVSGNGYFVLHSFAGAPNDGHSPYAGVIFGNDGYLYGTTFVGGLSSMGTVFRLLPDGSNYAVVYNFGGQASEKPSDAQYPQSDLIKDSTGNFYGTTTSDGGSGFGTVFKITPAGVESVLNYFGGNDQQNSQSTLMFDAQGNIYGTTAGDGSTYFGTVFKLD